jgi:lipopolysaccharide export system ATP-binding protein
LPVFPVRALAAMFEPGGLFGRRPKRRAAGLGAFEKEIVETNPLAALIEGTGRTAAGDLASRFSDVHAPARIELGSEAAADGAALDGVLSVHHLRKAYRMRRIIDDVSMIVRRGEAVGLLGPNGAGKTTLFYMISGLVRPDAGAIELDGHDVTRLPMYRRARLGIGYLPQEPSIFRGLTVEDNIRAVLEITQHDKGRRELELEALLEEFDIKALRKSPAVALSGGERRRCEIARALASRPSFILLDEPFAGIDPIAVADIQILVHHLKKRGIGVLITDHNVRETLGLIDRAYIIHAGRVLTEGSPAEIISNPEVRHFYLGDDFEL